MENSTVVTLFYFYFTDFFLEGTDRRRTGRLCGQNTRVCRSGGDEVGRRMPIVNLAPYAKVTDNDTVAASNRQCNHCSECMSDQLTNVFHPFRVREI